MVSKAALSFTPSEILLNTLTELDNDFKKVDQELQTYSERMRLAIHRYAKKGMLGWSASFSDVLPKADLNSAAQVAPLQQKMQNLLAADKRYSTRHDQQTINGYLRILDDIYQEGVTFSPLTEAHIQSLHGNLMRDISGVIQGQYKKVVNVVKITSKKEAGSEVSWRKSAEPGEETHIAMRELIAWYNNVRGTEPWTVAIACEFLLRFFRIHPFQDGNGRMGRSLFLLILMQSPQPFISQVAPYLGIYRHLDCHTDDFVAALGAAAPCYYPDPHRYDIERFCSFMLPILHEALDAIPKYKKKLDAALQEQMRVMMGMPP